MMTTSFSPTHTSAPEAALCPTGDETASLLRSQRPLLIDHWARSLKGLSGTSYCSRPIEELHSTCGECLDAYIALLETGDSGPLWSFIERVSHLRAALHFPPSDMTEAFMAFLETADAVLGPAVGTGDAFVRLLRDLRGCTRTALKAFVNTYLIHLDLAHSSLGSL